MVGYTVTTGPWYRIWLNAMAVAGATALHGSALWALLVLFRAIGASRHIQVDRETLGACAVVPLAAAVAAGNIALGVRGWRASTGAWRWFFGAILAFAGYLTFNMCLIAALLGYLLVAWTGP